MVAMAIRLVNAKVALAAKEGKSTSLIQTKVIQKQYKVGSIIAMYIKMKSGKRQYLNTDEEHGNTSDLPPYGNSV